MKRHGVRRQEGLVKRLLVTAVFASALLSLGGSAIGKPPATWDGLVQVKSKRLDLVYLQPGADFRGYTKVIIEPTEIAFAKNWQRDHNSATRSLSSQVSNQELRNAIAQGVAAAGDVLSKSWTRGGYAVVTDPGA